jgi:plasmid replication initiation protein
MKSVITVETEKIIKGKRKWEKYTWFTYAKYDEETGKATMTFSSELAAVLLEIKRLYAKINLADVGKLQSKYAIRLFEMAKSYESMAGKDGNESDAWYFERSLNEFRELFGIDSEAYKETRDFRKKVIEEPVKEINQAGIGLEIKSEGIKRGRNLVALRLNCKKAALKAPAKRNRGGKKAESQLELSDQNPAKARQEKELEHLKELYPDEFTGLYAQILEELPYLGGGPGEHIRQSAAELKALEALRERHGIVK